MRRKKRQVVLSRTRELREDGTVVMKIKGAVVDNPVKVGRWVGGGSEGGRGREKRGQMGLSGPALQS